MLSITIKVTSNDEIIAETNEYFEDIPKSIFLFRWSKEVYKKIGKN